MKLDKEFIEVTIPKPPNAFLKCKKKFFTVIKENEKRDIYGKGSVGIVEPKYFMFGEPPNEFTLQCGKKLGPIVVAYETYGKMDEKGDNVVLVCHALSGSAHAAGYLKGGIEGWWDDIIGPGKAIDTNKYFVICSNFIGSCYGTTGPASINPSTGKPYGLQFPVITIEDMVEVQKKLIEHLGIKKLLTVIGGSMGGMQALEWALRYPDMVRSAIIIAASPYITPQAIAFDYVGRSAIKLDPDWKNGKYFEHKKVPARGLAIARMIGHITYLSSESMKLKFGRKLKNENGYSYDIDRDIEFEVESYLEYQGTKFVQRFDANSYLYITRAMDYYNAVESHGNGDIYKAFEKIKSKILLISFTSDWLFPPEQLREMMEVLVNLGKDVSYVEIESPYGHDAFLIETDTETIAIRSFLDSLYSEISS